MHDKTPPESLPEARTDDRRVISMFDRQPVESTLDDAESEADRNRTIKMLEDAIADVRANKFNAGVLLLGDTSDTARFVQIMFTPGVFDRPFVFLGALRRADHSIQQMMDDIEGQDEE